MKRLLTYILFLLAISCSSPEGQGRKLFIRIQMPENFKELVPFDAQIKLINTGNGTTYLAQSDSLGIGTFDSEYGTYRISVQFKYNDNFYSYLFNGGLENIHLTPSNGSMQDTIDLPLAASILHKIVIKEIYYSGCYGNNGKSYQNDPYISLYNNSDEMVWLDSLCIGTVAPPVASKPSNWLKAPETKGLVAINYIGWQFPGTGHDYPLAPGETTVIAINAVDHTGGKYNHPNSVNLSKANWAFYHPSLTMQDITAGVPSLYMFKKLIGSLKSYVLGTAGAGIILYRIPNMSAEAYANTEKAIWKEPLTTASIDYLVIPEEWVIDCVDCVEDATKQGFKRVSSALDAESAYLPSGKYSGRSLHRKIAGNENGRTIYQDSNNSANDFEERIPTLK